MPTINENDFLPRIIFRTALARSCLKMYKCFSRVDKDRKGVIDDKELQVLTDWFTEYESRCLQLWDCSGGANHRHEIYVTQYRAMFVVNCEIKEKTVAPQGGQKRRKKRKGRESVGADEVNSESELARQVCCAVCSTEVGVYDKDEVYHFYDVLPSES